jgi:hypothetical protein
LAGLSVIGSGFTANVAKKICQSNQPVKTIEIKTEDA